MYTNQKQIFYVNSNNRLSGTHSNFTYSFNMDRTQNYDRVVLLAASIPKSYYLIISGSNTFTLTENTSSVTITITPGNYTRSSFASTLQSLLNSNSPNHYTYSITSNNMSTTYDQGIFYFSVSGNSGIQPIFTFTTYLYEQLGFNEKTSYQFSSNSLQSINVTNLTQETTLFLHSNMSINEGGDNVLQEIYATGEQTFSYINFINPIPYEYSKILTNDKSNSFTFTLTDENGNEINTNGININFTIMIYKSNDILNMIKMFLKYITLNNDQNNLLM